MGAPSALRFAHAHGTDMPIQVPDELTQYLMRKSGQDCKDPRL